MKRKKGFFDEVVVQEAQKTFNEKGIVNTSDRAVMVLVANHFDEELEGVRKFVLAGVIGLWTAVGGIIIGLLLALLK